MNLRFLLLLSALPACTLAAGAGSPEDAPGVVALASGDCDCSALPTTPCSRPACDDGTCYLAHTPDGEPADVDQPHGDCATAVCVGLAVVQAYEPHDAPTLPDECVVSVCELTGPVFYVRPACFQPEAAR